MEKKSTKVIPIANADDKRQLTAVLAATARGEYLPPQLLYKGKTAKCHPPVIFPDGWDFWHTDNHWSNEVVNTIVVMAAAEGTISARNISKLSSHGGHIVITKSWARSLLSRMGYVKRWAQAVKRFCLNF